MKPDDYWNSKLALHVFSELLSAGIQDFCICPGARNAPLIQGLQELQKKNSFLRTFYFFEERCASFFALGRIRQFSKPVAVITTSGTAVGELLPATMEAYYSSMPLVLLTADRPRSYRGSGAPQAAEQVGIFGIYSSPTIDLESNENLDARNLNWNKPIHINICFDEPLLEKESYLFSQFEASPSSMMNQKKPTEKLSTAELSDFAKKIKYPLAIVSGLRPDERSAVLSLLTRFQIPAYFEGISGLRESPRAEDIQIRFPDQMIERAHCFSYPVDGLIRIGGVPTLRLWRDLEAKYDHLPVLSLSSSPFSGLARKSVFLTGRIPELCQELETYLNKWSSFSKQFEEFLKHDRFIKKTIFDLFEQFPRSEPSLISSLSRAIPQQSRLYLGNSLPIREWDLAAHSDLNLSDCWASRGLNGIDGQLSTFLGYSALGIENWAILGDLTTLYDLPGPWILNQLQNTKIRLVVINNGGGKIFSQMFPIPEFQNQHQIRFESWAELWGISYQLWREIPMDLRLDEKNHIIELLPDEDETQRFWSDYRKCSRSWIS